MKKTLLTLALLTIAGTSMASELSNAMSVIAYNSKGEAEQSVTSERVKPEKTKNEMLNTFVNLEYRYIEIEMYKSSNSVDNKLELFPKNGTNFLGMEFNESSEITKFVSGYGFITRDESFVNEILLNNPEPTVSVYKNNKTKESSYSSINLIERKDKNIMASVRFQFDKPTKSKLLDINKNADGDSYDGLSTINLVQTFSLPKNGNYKLANYGSSSDKSYFIYIKASEVK